MRESKSEVSAGRSVTNRSLKEARQETGRRQGRRAGKTIASVSPLWFNLSVLVEADPAFDKVTIKGRRTELGPASSHGGIDSDNVVAEIVRARESERRLGEEKEEIIFSDDERKEERRGRKMRRRKGDRIMAPVESRGVGSLKSSFHWKENP